MANPGQVALESRASLDNPEHFAAAQVPDLGDLATVPIVRETLTLSGNASHVWPEERDCQALRKPDASVKNTV